jgi:hypothetical protein
MWNNNKITIIYFKEVLSLILDKKFSQVFLLLVGPTFLSYVMPFLSVLPLFNYKTMSG